VPLTSFERGKLKIAAHVREELDRAGIKAQLIQCKSGGIHMPPDTARLIVTVDGTPSQLDLQAHEVEDCEDIVAGEVWRRIADLLAQVTRRGG
jgi:galactitol-specific phosphotransferase system IIB component